jgi:glycosyltransferase 2 family protein
LKKFWINLTISLAIGALFIWLAVRGVNWAEVNKVFSQVDLSVLLIYFFILSSIQVVRILRWGVLLKPLGQVGLFRLFSVGSVGILALILLPLRLGEFARPILISEKGKIRTSAALATVVVERVVDSLAMASLLVLILLFLEDKMIVPLEIQSWAFVILGIFVLLLIFLIVAYRHQESTIAWFKRWLLRPLPAKFKNRLVSILRSFIGGLQALPNFKLASIFIGMTIVYWAMAGAGILYMFGAFEETSQLGWIEALTVLSVLCVGLMIPAGPGMIGNFHYFVKLGLSLFVSEAVLGSAGVAYAILVHAMQLAQQVVWGLPFLFTRHISFARFWETTRNAGSSGLEEGTAGSGD